MLTLLFGTDWIRNRDQILQMIADDVTAEKAGRILIVPELISHDTERRLCKAAGDTCSRFAEVLSFTRLAKRVSEYDRQPIRPCLDQGGRLVAMASATKQIHSKLKAYASVETKPEFFSGLVDAVDEFKRCCITPGDLMDASFNTEGSLAQKLEELSLLLESYDSVCSRGKCDPRDQMSWLLEELEDSTYGADHVFYIDGFPDFTRQHLNIIKHLIENSANVTVSLTCDVPGSDEMAFTKAGETAVLLMQIAEACGAGVKTVCLEPRDHPVALAGKLLLSGDIGVQRCEALKVIRANSAYQECEVALEAVLGYVADGARYRDINIVCGEMPAYRNVLEMLFEKCNIPLYISGTEDILDEPAINTLFAALEAVLGGFELQDVLQYLKSMLSPLDAETCDMVENYAILWGIHGKHWEENWNNHPNGLGHRMTDQAREALSRLNNARRTAIDPLTRLRNGLDASRNLGDMVRALYDFLETIHYGKRLSEYAEAFASSGHGREAQILNQLWDILLSALEQLYDTLGQTAWETENFLRLLKLLISQYDVGTIPPVLDAVSAGPVNAMRCQQCKYLIVLGAAEGALPGYAGSAGVLTDQERVALRQLGIPLTGGSMDGLLAEFADIYGVFSSPDTAITVCCSSGEPSFVYKRLAALAGGEVPANDLLGAAIANDVEASAYLLRYAAEAAAGELGILSTYHLLESKRDHQLGSITTENIKKLYGSELNLSASRVDRQALCRMSYFLQYGLFAQERKMAEVDPAEFGTYVHAVLEETVRTVMLQGGIRNISADEMVQIAKAFSEEYAKERFSALETERVVYLFRRNWDELEKIVRELWEELQNSDFDPVGLEVAFGDGCQIPAIDISGENMSAKLKGVVDRVDRWDHEGKNYYRVVDYKTGKKDFDYCDILNGYGMQMLLYLFALQDTGADIVGENPVPAGVQYFPARVPLLSADGALTEEEARAGRVKLWKRKGLILSAENVLAAMENTEKPIRMPYSRKKDGSISGDLADHKQFSLLRDFVFKRVGKMVDEIASGNVEPNPYSRGTSFSACTYCPYGSVCHKATVEDRRNFRTVSDKQFWEDVQKEVDKDGR